MKHLFQFLTWAFTNWRSIYESFTSVFGLQCSLFDIRILLLRSAFLIPCSLFLFLFTMGSSCAQETYVKEYPAVVGDIEYDPALDDPGFRICSGGEIYNYYNFGKGVQFKGEKPAIVEYFQKKFKGSFKGENGYVAIRFVVNCEGISGRFRMQQMDFDYQPKQFSKELTTQLLTLTSNLYGWIPAMYEDNVYDYYQYLLFKIEDGVITEILP